MLTFLGTFLLVTVVLLVCSIPVFVVCLRRGQTLTPRRFAVAAVLLGLVAGALESGSDLLVERCLAAGNSACFDYGGTGLMILLFVGFLFVSSTRAWLIARN